MTAYEDRHHPKYRGHEAHRDGTATFTFTAFTGQEPEPQPPGDLRYDPDLNESQMLLLADEYETALILWERARFRTAAAALLAAAAPARDAYLAAADQVALQFTALTQGTVPDGQWSQLLLRLSVAWDHAEDLARAWDQHVEALRKLRAGHHRKAGASALSLEAVAAETGTDIGDWFPQGPVFLSRMQAVVTRQKGLLRQAGLTPA